MSQRWTLWAAVLGSGIVFLDSTIINVALPRIGRELPSSLFGVLEAQSYVYNGYLLTLSALLILAGALNDFYGRRRTFAIGLMGFGVTSVLCGLSPTMEWLVLSRVLQGVAGALLVPGSLALITSTFTGGTQGRAFGVWAGASSATTILGPVIGGVLVDGVSWRAAFLINVPLVAWALWATMAHVPESRDEQASGEFDWLGAVVVAMAVGGLAFGAIYGQQREWRDALGYGALGVGALATLGFPALMARRRHPLIPLELFRSHNFTITNISTFLIYGALYVAFYYAPLYMQGTLGYTAAAAGVAAVPGTLLLVFLSSRFGALAASRGPRWFMAAGPAIMMIGILWLARVPETSAAWTLYPDSSTGLLPPADYLRDFLPGFLIHGMGLAIMVAPLTTCLMQSVPARHAGVGSAINNAISRIGPQLAGAVIFVAVTASFYAGLASRVPGLEVSSAAVRARIAPLNAPADGTPAEQVAAARSASTDAFRLAMLISAGLLGAGAVINALGIRNPPPARTR
ncbi:MAG: MFS transporter [Armatimonadota bacterium]|nr:MFS transporter [Armatimonadota bacterium]